MSGLVLYRETVGGVWVSTGKKRIVKNLGWLFRHAGQVTELHFKQDGLEYRLSAYLMDGTIYSTYYASREVFAQVFNRNRTLRDVVVFFNNEEWQACGQLTAKPEPRDGNAKCCCGSAIKDATRAELDAWVESHEGCEFKVIEGVYNG